MWTPVGPHKLSPLGFSYWRQQLYLESAQGRAIWDASPEGQKQSLSSFLPLLPYGPFSARSIIGNSFNHL